MRAGVAELARWKGVHNGAVHALCSCETTPGSWLLASAGTDREIALISQLKRDGTQQDDVEGPEYLGVPQTLLLLVVVSLLD